jgi:hypothetical protein
MKDHIVQETTTYNNIKDNGYMQLNLSNNFLGSITFMKSMSKWYILSF